MTTPSTTGPGEAIVKSAAVTNSIGMKLVRIEPGKFLMGSPVEDKDAHDHERPQHRVRITRPFDLGVTEVTVGQFRRFVEAAGYRTEAERDGMGSWGWNDKAQKYEQNPKYTWRAPGFAQTDEHPVVNVSWNDAVAFCAWLSQEEGQTYCLPTEAEWEYACRAGSTTRFCFGDDAARLGEYAWFSGNSGRRTYPVGQKRPNAFGLYDMHGNVWEWCRDEYKADYYKESPVVDPVGPSQAADRVNRGGGWGSNPRYCRSAYRGWHTPGNRNLDLGFRVARVQSGR